MNSSPLLEPGVSLLAKTPTVSMPPAVFLAGVSCVGKTSIGARLAARIGYRFYDLDSEIEAHFSQPIEHLKAQTLTPHGFRAKFSSVVLWKLLAIRHETGIVIALPPSGLKDCLYALIRRLDCAVIVLKDTAENILERVTFYDENSRPISKTLTARERPRYLRQIKDDMEYFGRSFQKADAMIDIAGLDIENSAAKVECFLRGGSR